MCSPKPSGGIEERLAQRTATWCGWTFYPDLCSVLLLPMMSSVFKGTFIEGLFNSREVPFSSPSIRRAAIARFLLFDLASFQSEAAASPFIYPAIGHCKHSSVCLCICVFSACVCKVRVSGGRLDIGVRTVWEDQPGSRPPLSSILQREKRKKESERIDGELFYWGLCVLLLSLNTSRHKQ